MTKLEELIEKLCPDGVEYKSLIDLCDVLYGFPCDASKFNDDMIGLPLVRIRDVLEGKSDTYTIESVPEEYKIHSGDLLVGMDGNFHVGIWKDIEAILCQRVCRISSKDNEVLLDGFLNHLIGPIMKKIELGKQSGTVKHLLAKDIKAIKLPVPPLEVQREIVRILDNFTFLTAELAAELAARQKQYEYYRDLLLDFGTGDGEAYSVPWLADMLRELCPDGVEYKELSEVLIIKNGKDYKNFGEGNVPVYGSGGIMTYIDTAVYEKPSVLIPRKGSLDKLYFVQEPFWTVDTIFYTDINVNITEPKYIFYYLQKEHLEKLNKAGGVPSLTQNVLNKVKLPVPPLEVQQRIVDILDRFDALCNDISNGLPAEIEARQKQYEYYRDKLLTFKELKKEA